MLSARNVEIFRIYFMLTPTNRVAGETGLGRFEWQTSKEKVHTDFKSMLMAMGNHPKNGHGNSQFNP